MAGDKLLTTVSLRPSGDQETQVRESSPEWETLVSRRPEATSHSHTCPGLLPVRPARLTQQYNTIIQNHKSKAMNACSANINCGPLYCTYITAKHWQTSGEEDGALGLYFIIPHGGGGQPPTVNQHKDHMGHISLDAYCVTNWSFFG